MVLLRHLLIFDTCLLSTIQKNLLFTILGVSFSWFYSCHFAPIAWETNAQISALSSIVWWKKSQQKWHEWIENVRRTRTELQKREHRIAKERAQTFDIGFPAPCPALTSILIKSGLCSSTSPTQTLSPTSYCFHTTHSKSLSEPAVCWSVAMYLKLWRGTTLSSWSAVVMRTYGYFFLSMLCSGLYLQDGEKLWGEWG